MAEKYEIVLRTIDGEKIPVTVFNPGGFAVMFISDTVPSQESISENPTQYRKFFHILINECTDIRPEIMQYITMGELQYLINSIIKTVSGDKPRKRKLNKFKVKGESIFDFNENGTIDLQDWQ